MRQDSLLRPRRLYDVPAAAAKKYKDRQVLKLSDAFTVAEGAEQPCLEMTATMLNINLRHNQVLMARCKTLNDYAYFVAQVRQRQAEGYDLTTAIHMAIDECIKNDILADFLRVNRAEVIDMLLYEYNEEEHISSEKELSFAEGQTQGRTEGLTEGLAEGEAKIIAMIRKKVIKGHDVPAIAEELELEESYVRQAADLLSADPAMTDLQIAQKFI